MRKSQFTEAQIAFILKQAEDGRPVAEATLYNWRRRYAWPMPSEVKRLRQLEANGKLKRIVADLSL